MTSTKNYVYYFFVQINTINVMLRDNLFSDCNRSMILIKRLESHVTVKLNVPLVQVVYIYIDTAYRLQYIVLVWSAVLR